MAEDEGALAIVVGASHRGPARAASIPGSVGDRLLETAPCPVAVAPNGYRSDARPIRRIGVGFLATPEADEALGAAVGIAARTGAAVEVLSVVELPPAAALGYAWGYGKSEQTARDDLSSSLASTIDDVGSLVEIDGKVVDGYADDELARLSAEVDLLICGSRRLGRARARDARQRLDGRAAQGALPGARRPARGPRRPREPSDDRREIATPRAGRRRHPDIREVVMTPPIVVGVDPLRHDPEAPVLAALLARATGAPVVAVAVYPVETPRPDPAAATSTGTSTAAPRSPASRPSSRRSTASRSRPQRVSGPSAAHVIHDLAQDLHAGLLVLGSSHHGAIGRIALGSTADRLLHGTPCPVAVAPRGFAERMRGLDRIGAAFLDSEEGYEALRAAAALASACGAELRAATAVEPIAWSATSYYQPYDVDDPPRRGPRAAPRRGCARRSTASRRPCPPTPRCS